MVKKVTRYEAADGMQYVTEAEAEYHDARQRLCQLLEHCGPIEVIECLVSRIVNDGESIRVALAYLNAAQKFAIPETFSSE